MSQTKTKKKAAVEVIVAPVPFQDRLVIAKFKPETVSAGGLIIPESAIVEENKGLVVAVGPLVGRTTASAMQLAGDANPNIPKVGDTVIFGEYAGMSVEIGDKKFLVVKETDVLCKL